MPLILFLKLCYKKENLRPNPKKILAYGDLMLDLTITSPYVDFRVDITWAGQSYARVDLNPMPESTLSPVRDLGFGL